VPNSIGLFAGSGVHKRSSYGDALQFHDEACGMVDVCFQAGVAACGRWRERARRRGWRRFRRSVRNRDSFCGDPTDLIVFCSNVIETAIRFFIHEHYTRARGEMLEYGTGGRRVAAKNGVAVDGGVLRAERVGAREEKENPEQKLSPRNFHWSSLSYFREYGTHAIRFRLRQPR
jgi:hypothetical protein